MARLRQNKPSTGKKILLVDDQKDYALTTAAIIEREGHTVVIALSGEEALEILHKEHFDLLLLDYFMPGGITGEDVVKKIRAFNPYVQVILQTGYSGEYPPREMLKRLEIQGYHDKADGPDKLLMWVDVGLKSAFMVNMLNKSRQGLQFILDITPELHKIQPLEDLLQGILLQISGLLGIVNAFMAILPVNSEDEKKSRLSEGFIAILEEETNLVIRAKTGKFVEQATIINSTHSTDFKVEMNAIHDVLHNRQIEISKQSTIIPLVIGEQSMGIIYLEQEILINDDIELLQIFANQAAVAILNARLYEMATIDVLTKVYVRRFFDKCLMRELRTLFRTQSPLTIILLDMDGLKKLNDTAGHNAGDKALRTIGRVLRKAIRNTDFIGRFGGDEFVLALPQTTIAQSKVVAERILELLSDKTIRGPNDEIPIRVSLGVVETGIIMTNSLKIPRPITQEYFTKMMNRIIEEADKKLYEAKRKGGNQISYGDTIPWPVFDED
ncbi:MAG: diguanylate cyclase [Spirochaetales bacterium]|nr:diguanylate cyclase [Spirochaetales bacterium]